jgi:muramoyltetrapeptide carboxypeptidase LdcA involved in peptidoglycan recycling
METHQVLPLLFTMSLQKKKIEIGFSKIVVQTYAMLQKGDQTTLKIAVCDFKPTL